MNTQQANELTQEITREVGQWSDSQRKAVAFYSPLLYPQMDSEKLSEVIKYQIAKRCSDEGLLFAPGFEINEKVAERVFEALSRLKEDLDFLSENNVNVDWKSHEMDGYPEKGEYVFHFFEVTGVNAGFFGGEEEGFDYYGSELGGFLGGDVTHYLPRYWRSDKKRED